jgi:phospholipid/cholesterol/gamma-HCH transport system substrate-binding protein
MSIAEQVDPIKLNTTLTALTEATTGLGEKFGDSLINANRIMDDLNPWMPQIRADMAALADLADVYANASPDLWDGLENAVTPARTLNDRQGNIDTALLAAIGFGNTAADIFERGGPYFVRAAEDLLPTTKLLDDYRAMIFCTIRNYAEVGPRFARVLAATTAMRSSRTEPSFCRAIRSSIRTICPG